MAIMALQEIKITGNVGQEPDVKYKPMPDGSEQLVVSINVGVYGGKVDFNDPNSETFTKWYICRFRSNKHGGEKLSLAEEVAERVKTGARVMVSGRPQYWLSKDENGNLHDYKKDNKNVLMLIEADDILIVEKDPNAPSAGGAKRELPPI